MEENKKMNLFQVIAYLISGIIVLDTFAAPAEMGLSAIGLWLIVTIFFMIPNGFINAELGAAYPDGFVSWVKESMGKLHATIAGWFYWVNVAMWLPAVFIVFTIWIAYAFNLFDTGYWNNTVMFVVAFVANWALIFTVRRGIDLGVFLSTLGTIIKVGVLLIFGTLGIVYVAQNGIEGTGLSVGSFFPTLANITSIGFVTAIVFNLLGLELIAAITDKVRGGAKALPKAIIVGSIIIGALYIFGTYGVLAAATEADLADVGFITDALPNGLYILVENVGLPVWVYTVLMIGVLFTLMSNMIAWIIGASEILEDVTFAQDFKVFNERHPKYGTLSKSYILLGIISSVFLVIGFFILDAINGEAFWTVLALSMVIFIFPYIYLSPAIIKLRKRDGVEGRSFVIPGGNVGMWIASILNFVFIALAIVMLFVDQSPLYYSIVIPGTIITAIIPFILHKFSKDKSATA
ncbi:MULTISPECIES: APC family permease [unclassified Oceanispirochaeta]|uniref:APC family permease n=1 Tax=unclassified Oceanispirochaeta TaxID=2635722 RepID=UPI000E099A65|nr:MULTISPECIES: APC family permease [unclassified Oceanispirochaeta]MBF9016871.1 amino acid permease [Oceanispirochaeta sp. M2]NPD73234.1 amino acid permease [Oceanispirochaeta sp. M1]RDG31100.1 amino acid permease [Oceanispirochaeta sp. M1]